MPVKIPSQLPARELLENENIFVMSEHRAVHQDIRPLRIVVLNLMPTKIQTETQILRLLGNTAIQIEITLLHMESHESKNTPVQHLESFYSTFECIRDKKFDGLVITGAPVENLEFEDVDYWQELIDIMDWSSHNVFSTLYICWGAQAGLFHHYGIQKYPLPKKMFGIYSHEILEPHEPIIRGFDDNFLVPHSRHTGILRKDILNEERLCLIAESPEAGVYLVVSNDGRRIFVTGHPEYDKGTLQAEYERDFAKGFLIEVPNNYFPENDPNASPSVTWRSHANLLYTNWLNYYVYQMSPFDLSMLDTDFSDIGMGI